MSQLQLLHANVLSEQHTALFMGEDALRLEAKYASRLREDHRLGRWVSYAGNKDAPILRLYRYKEAFAFQFVEGFIARFGLTPADYVFAPFCLLPKVMLGAHTV